MINCSTCGEVLSDTPGKDFIECCALGPFCEKCYQEHLKSPPKPIRPSDNDA